MSRLSPEYRRRWFAEHPLYASWQGIRRLCGLCRGMRERERRLYMGVRMCREWAESYGEFERWCFVNGWQPGLQVARIDKNGDYEPGNCVCVEWRRNVNMRRNTLRIGGRPLRELMGEETRGRGDKRYRRTADRITKCGWDVASACCGGVVPPSENARIATRVRLQRALRTTD